jgi:L-lactate dehydrogenase complex protein LldG
MVSIMSKHARKRIFNRLNLGVKTEPVYSTSVREFTPKKFNQIEKIENLKLLMETMRTEVYVNDSENWIESLINVLKGKGLRDLLYGPSTDMGKALEKQWEMKKDNLPELIPYEENIERFKSRLFEIDASITTTKGVVADVGSIILWPDEKEPRTMSLVPPVHIAVLEKEKIYNNLSEAILREGWSKGMPTNVLLISGPSKTADIELILAYGVHGPKELILLIV